MAHFAQIDENNVVIRVIVIDDYYAPDPAPENSESDGINFILNELAKNDESLLGKWKQTSYNKNFRNKFASPKDIYYEERDAFISPKPYSSWTLNEENLLWVPPIPMPTEGGPWVWDEEAGNWEEIPMPPSE